MKDMKYITAALLLCLGVGCVYGNDPCDHINCRYGFLIQRQSYITVCGSDGQTYDFCDFKKEACRNHTLTLTKLGSCQE